MGGFQLSKRAMQVVIEPLDPAVQAAVQEVQRIAPDTLMKVKRIVVHPSGGAGELGHVEMGKGKDPQEIHIFKSRIEQIARQQLGASGKQIDPKQLAEAVKMALVETISHEGAHIGGAKRSEEQIGKGPFFGEGEAEAKAKEVMQREKQLMPKPAQTRFSLSKRAGLDRLPIAADPAMWTDEQLAEAVARPELFGSDKEKFRLAVEQLSKRGLAKKIKPQDIGEWREHGWWLLMWAGIPLAFYDNDAKASMARQLLVKDFAEDGTQPEAAAKFDPLHSRLRWRLDEAMDLGPAEDYEEADRRRGRAGTAIDELATHPLYAKRRKEFAEKVLNIAKAPRDFVPSKEAVPSGPRPTETNADAAGADITDMRYGETKPGFVDPLVDSNQAASDASDELVADAAKKLRKRLEAERAGFDPEKLNDDRAYASFIPAPLSKRAGKKKRLGDLILEAALALDDIRERHLPDAPMAEPNLRFAIKVSHKSPDLIRLGLDLLKDDRLHPISADIESAIEFNKTAIASPGIAKLLGAVSGELDFAKFGMPEFVTELAGWQDKHGLMPSGKLDAETIAAFDSMKPKGIEPLPRNFGTVIPGLVYRGGMPKAEQLENLRDKFGVQKVISLHDNPDIARICGVLGIQHVPAFLTNGGPEDLGRKVLGDSVLDFIGDVPTYIHCFFGADRTGSVAARIRTESGWPCQLAYAEAKAYGFKDMFADLIDWLSEPCVQKLDIDTDAIRKRMGDKEPYENPEISQDLVEPAPTDLPFETSNSGWETTSDTIVNTFGIGSIPISDSSHGW